MTIRELDQAGLEPFVELMGQIEVGSQFDGSDPELAGWVRDKIRRRCGSGARFYAMYDDGEPVGIAGLVIEKIPCTKWSRCELVDIGIYKEHRRKGYGSKLLGFAEEQARAAGCWAVHLLAYSADRDAIAFYLANGYAVVGAVADTNGPEEDGDAWLRKVLVEE
jgi:GNAT superfamily N-acetyltransferase